jgi:capsular polysaccharide biosynthesis protein
MQLSEYLDVVRKRWWVVLLTVVVATVTAYILARSQPSTYRSALRLEVNSRIDNGQVLASDRLLRQLAARVKTTSVAETIDERLQLGLGTGAVLGKLQAQAYPDVLHIEIDVDDELPDRAERIAAAAADVVREQQSARMADTPQQERITLGIVDRPSAARLVWPQTRQIALAGALAGLVVGVLLAFVLHYIEAQRASSVRTQARAAQDVTSGPTTQVGSEPLRVER